MAVLAAKLHHEYYGLGLAPVAAVLLFATLRLPAIAARLAAEGLTVVTLDIDSDSYPMMVLLADQVGTCQRLAQLAGYGTVTDWRTPPTTAQ